jgi:hypothetical protein
MPSIARRIMRLYFRVDRQFLYASCTLWQSVATVILGVSVRKDVFLVFDTNIITAFFIKLYKNFYKKSSKFGEWFSANICISIVYESEGG